jgi:archaellum biogenesis protein FlaJ (TadC family)
MRRTEGDRFIISRISHFVVLVCILTSCAILLVMMSGISAPMYVLARQVLVILSILAIVAVLLTAKGTDPAGIKREETAVNASNKRIVVLLLAMAAIVGLIIAASVGGDWRLDAIVFVLVFVNVGIFLHLTLLPR